MYQSTTTVAPVKTTGLAGIKAKILNKYYATKPKVMAKLPFKSHTHVAPVNTQPSNLVNKAKYAPVKAKSGLYNAKNKLVSNVSAIKPKVMSKLPGTQGVQQQQHYNTSTVVAKPSIFQKAKLAFLKAKSSIFHKKSVVQPQQQQFVKPQSYY